MERGAGEGGVFVLRWDPVLGMMDDVDLVLRRMRRDLKRGRGGIGDGGGGMTTVTITVWEMPTVWTTADGKRERRKYEADSHCWTSYGMMYNVDSVLWRLRRDLNGGGVGRGG